MGPSRTLLVLLVSGGFIGGSLRTGLSFSSLPLPTRTRIANPRNSCCSRQRSLKQYHFQRAPATSTVVPVSTTHGDTVCRSSTSTGLHALPSPLLGLPSLDGMPAAENSAVVPPGTPATSSNSNSATSSASTAASVQRSRRGKYPVIELWRQETGDFLLDDERGLADDDNANEFVGREQSARVPRSAHTALGYLRDVLGLGLDQTDAMLEAFPALADVSPDKLDVRAKLVRQLRYCTVHSVPRLVPLSLLVHKSSTTVQ